MGALIGMAITSFTVIQIGIVLFFGIPTTSKLNKARLLKEPNPIQKGNLISLVIWSGIYIGAFLLLQYWSTNVFSGFLVGTVIIILLGLRQFGANSNNVSDYVASNERFFAEGVDRERVISEIARM